MIKLNIVFTKIEGGMLTNISDNTNEGVNKIINELLGFASLEDLIPDEQERRKQFTPIFKKIILSESKKEIKEHINELIEKLEELGVPIAPKKEDNKESVPILWSNDRPETELMSDEYNLKEHHYDDEKSPLFDILWEVVPTIISRMRSRNFKKYDFNGTHCKSLASSVENCKSSSNFLHIPGDRLLSEVYVQKMSLKHILDDKIRIEFGQNDPERGANEVCFATDAVMAVSELPILLDRIAQYNIENPGKEIYLENVGVSIGEINSGKFKDISGRYGKGENGESKNNEGANLIIVKAVERDKVSGEILQEHNKTVLSLKDLILKREKQRLKECIKRLNIEENKEKTSEDLEKKSNTQHNISDDENKQYNFIEKARQKQEIDYLIEKKLGQQIEEKDPRKIEEKRKLKEEFKTKKSLIDKSEEDNFIKWTAKHQEELEKKEEEKVKSLQDKIKEILEQGEQNIGKSQTQLVSEREEESKNQTTEMTVG